MGRKKRRKRIKNFEIEIDIEARIFENGELTMDYQGDFFDFKKVLRHKFGLKDIKL